jgi:uncharacterized protein YggT (Ycf19 family)
MVVTIERTENKKSLLSLNYNFYTTNLFPNYLTPNITYSNRSHISIKNYSYNTNTPHVKSNISGEDDSYIVNEIRIYKTTHMSNALQGSRGEIIIETISKISGNFIYVCIPLRAGSGEKTPLDSIIESLNDSGKFDDSKCPKTLSLNKIIPKQTEAYQYKLKSEVSQIFGESSQKSKYVVVFTNPINVNNDNLDKLNSKVIELKNNIIESDSNYNLIKVTDVATSKDNNIYIQCDGDDPAGAKIQPTLSYKLNEKDINQVIVTILICFFVVVIFSLIDQVSGKGESPFGKMIAGIITNYNGPITVFVIAMVIIIFSLFITAYVKKQSKILKTAIIMMTVLLTMSYPASLNIVKQYVVEFK